MCVNRRSSVTSGGVHDVRGHATTQTSALAPTAEHLRSSARIMRSSHDCIYESSSDPSVRIHRACPSVSAERVLVSPQRLIRASPPSLSARLSSQSMPPSSPPPCPAAPLQGHTTPVRDESSPPPSRLPRVRTESDSSGGSSGPGDASQDSARGAGRSSGTCISRGASAAWE